MVDSFYMWIIFAVMVLFFILLDLVIISRFLKMDDIKVSSKVTLGWVLLAIAFCYGVYLQRGQQDALMFLTGYVIELALSFDNVFVFILLFEICKIKKQYQHKVLFIGILSAIIMRLLMITFGIYLVNQFTWIFYVFGAFLIYSGVRFMIDAIKPKQDNDKEGKLLIFLRKYFRISTNSNTDKFFIKEGGKWSMTSLFVVLVLIEQSDLIFALDSIPAILAITDDVFIVFTSNIFAILGLRSMYFMLSSIIDKFIYLRHALAIMLFYIGCKMILLVQGIHIPTAVSLCVIVGILSIAILFSIFKTKHSKNSLIK